MKNYILYILAVLTISGCSSMHYKDNTGYKKCIESLGKDRKTIEAAIGQPYSVNLNNDQTVAVYSFKNKNIPVCKNIQQLITLYDNKNNLINYQINLN